MNISFLRHRSGGQIWYWSGYFRFRNALTRVEVGDTRLISTLSAEEILRSAQRGGETVLSLMTLALVSWHFSISLISGVSVETSRLLVLLEALSSGTRNRSLSESLTKGSRGGRVLLCWMQGFSDEWDELGCLRMVKSWRRAGMEATIKPMFCSRLLGWISGVWMHEKIIIREKG